MSFSWCRLGKGAGAGDYHLAHLEAAQTQAAKDSYYTSSSESPGEWWSPDSALIKHARQVEPSEFRAILAGFNPHTGEALVRQTGESHTAGFDMTLSAPKSVSVLWACADDDTRADIERAQTRAVTRAYGFMKDRGLFVTRTGENGANREPAADVAIARFRHHTSRAGDPHLHDHSVISNVCMGADGKTRTLDTADILQWQGAVAAAYRTELAQALGESGFATRKVDRNFEVEGIADDVIKAFSKRRDEIEDAAREAGISTKRDRSKTDKIATSTREKKDLNTTPEELSERWESELKNLGYARKDVVSMAQMAGVKGLVDEKQIACDAIAEAILHESVIEQRHLLRLLLEHGQGKIGIEQVEALIPATGAMQIGTESGKPVYSARHLIGIERQMLLDGIERQQEKGCWYDEKIVRQVLAERPDMIGEQARLLWHVVGGQGVAIGEGSAGSGKSFLTDALVEAAEKSGCRVRGFAPSWKAADVLRRESGIEDIAALQGFVLKLDSGFEKLTKNDVVIVDEAGMVSLLDLAKLLRHARLSGAKVILLGDTQQLEAVGAGAPMVALAREIGSERMSTIRRQRDSTALDGSKIDRRWMRDASMAFAEGRVDTALKAFDAHNRICWCSDRDTALDTLCTDWKAHVRDSPAATHLVIATRNADVRELNPLLRERYRELGRLTGDDIAITAIDRSGFERKLEIAAGDRVTFGERLEQYDINRSDIGTIVDIAPDVNGDHELIIVLDKHTENGTTRRIITAKLSELVGKREFGQLKCIQMQHAYAGTNHLAQGASVDKAFALNAHGMDARASYVAMTRHKFDVQMYVDTDRVIEKLVERSDDGKEPSQDEVKAFVYAESMKQRTKKNIVDYIANKDEWLATGRVEFGERQMPEQKKTDVSPLRERMDIRSQHQVSEPMWPDPDELDRFAHEIDFRSYLENRGWRAVEGKESYGLRMCKGEILRDSKGKFHAAEMVMIKRESRGKWVYTNPKDGKDSGSIIKFVQSREGLNLGQVRKALRPLLRDGAIASPAARQQAAALKAASAAPAEERAIAAVRARFAAMQSGGDSEYLKSRALDKNLPSLFPHDLKIGGKGVLAFAHRDGKGEVCGYEIKGQVGTEKINRFSQGGRKSLFFAGQLAGASRIVLCESAIDALSKRALDRAPPATLYTSMGGRPSAKALEEIAYLVRCHPAGQIEIACDRDGPGLRMAADLAGLVAGVRGPGEGEGLHDFAARQERFAGFELEYQPADRVAQEYSKAAVELMQMLPSLPPGTSITVPVLGRDWNEFLMGQGRTQEQIMILIEEQQEEEREHEMRQTHGMTM